MTKTSDARVATEVRSGIAEDSWARVQAEQEGMKDREFVRFSAFRVDAAWRRLPGAEKERHKRDFEEVIGFRASTMMVYAYSLVGTRGDADFLLWQASRELGDLHGLAADINRSAFGSFLTTSYSYLAMTKRSIYLNRYEREYAKIHGGKERLDRARLAVSPQGSRFLFVYPMVKTRAWYELSQEERQRMMDEHIRVGHQWPDVKLNTTYSYGLDDQEFVVAFESDHPGRFLDLVMALRLTEASSYTERDVPALTGIALPLREVLEALG